MIAVFDDAAATTTLTPTRAARRLA